MVWICMNRVRIDRRYEKDDKEQLFRIGRSTYLQDFEGTEKL